MRLFNEYPRPWLFVADNSIDPDKTSGGFEVFDANGKSFIYGGTYSGDGDDYFYLDRIQVEELVRIVNSRDQVERLTRIELASKALVKAKGRHNSKIAYECLEVALNPENAISGASADSTDSTLTVQRGA